MEAWPGTVAINKTKLNQKHAFRIIFFKDKLIQAKPLLQSINALNTYHIFHILSFVQKVKNTHIPQILRAVLSVTNNKYITSAKNIFEASL